jgi:hypothetical protein
MSKIIIARDQIKCGWNFVNIADVLSCAESMFNYYDKHNNTPVTFSVEKDGYLVAAFTNRRITLNKNMAFDTTDSTLRLHHWALMEVEPSRIESICEYFGVYCLEEVTLSALNFARHREANRNKVVRTITIQVKLQLSADADADMSEVVNNIDCVFNPKVVGVNIVGKEIVLIN